MRFPAPTNEEIVEVEGTVGYPLPSALVELYARRGNGGFGPDYGLLGLGSGHLTDQGDTALSLYRIFNQPDQEDPVGLGPSTCFPFFTLAVPFTTA